MRDRAGAAKVGVAGMGLIGGSIALGLRRAGHEILGLEPDPRSRATADARGMVDRWFEDAGSLARSAGMIFLAAPPDANLELLSSIARAADHPILITDTGSVKGPIATRWQSERSGFPGAAFVGGHPMAGSERTGADGSRADLFEGATWYLCSEAEIPEALLEFLRALGASPRMLNAEEHDRIMATASHLPQLLAWALRADWNRLGLDSEAAGPVYRELTRIAKSPPELWGQIAGQNRVELARAIRRLQRALDPIADSLESDATGTSSPELRGLLP